MIRKSDPNETGVFCYHKVYFSIFETYQKWFDFLIGNDIQSF